mmetsp:Transcript_50461/g.90768  ORF Transcript_50461/g.90768 Transcript_50461/m.90768 type:complete len:208 (-) Transcript_50461:104-727(-)
MLILIVQVAWLWAGLQTGLGGILAIRAACFGGSFMAALLAACGRKERPLLSSRRGAVDSLFDCRLPSTALLTSDRDDRHFLDSLTSHGVHNMAVLCSHADHTGQGNNCSLHRCLQRHAGALADGRDYLENNGPVLAVRAQCGTRKHQSPRAVRVSPGAHLPRPSTVSSSHALRAGRRPWGHQRGGLVAFQLCHDIHPPRPATTGRWD